MPHVLPFAPGNRYFCERPETDILSNRKTRYWGFFSTSCFVQVASHMAVYIYPGMQLETVHFRHLSLRLLEVHAMRAGSSGRRLAPYRIHKNSS